MEEKLFNRIMEKEMSKEEELKIPDSINIKLGKAYEIIKNDEADNVKKRKTNRKRNAIIAASLAFLVLTTVVVTPALADNIPPLKELSQYLKKMYFYNDNYITKASQINMSKTYDGIEIALQGVIYDDSSLKFIYTVTSDKKLQWGVQLRKNSLKINGKELPNNQYFDRISMDDRKISKEDDKLEKYAVITSYDISDLKLDDDVSIDWCINEIHTQNYKFAEGNWDFNFKASKELLKENSKIFNINYSTNIGGYKFSIDKIIFTPLETKILASHDPKFYDEYYKVIKSEKKEDEVLKEKIEQLDGELNFNNLYICDENGKALEGIGGRGYNGKEVMLFKPMTYIPKKLVITPFSWKLNNRINKVYKDDQFINLKDIKAPLEIKQGKDMSFNINSIEQDNNKLKINVAFKGDFIERRAREPFVIVPKSAKKYQSNIDLFDSEASNVRKVDSWEYYEKASNINNTLDYEFNLNKDEEYYLVYNKYEDGAFMKDRQITLDLSK
ncbi:DUF4179 domain-containing protein [Clostridium folliculivorans]|uniref:DUF4179 domain-containing protein n=1 Tax=Clostridium folliculivorans TaxID=2886038 RepID=A0A9W6DC19_9CLOT|nr:DUF4179 domain-containing protein [Clostridium folliculivorans]GKU26522.1 hypothetical protein CFOLD11_33490 [Clostridium folliculivorans]GKU29046.1 hypothetical protein CFB3_11520 [Clostridium folliculivorans]